MFFIAQVIGSKTVVYKTWHKQGVVPSQHIVLYYAIVWVFYNIVIVQLSLILILLLLLSSLINS